MLRRMLSIGLVAGIGVLAGGCYKVHYAYDGPKLLTTGASLGVPAEAVSHFEARDRQFYLFFGIFPLGDPINGAELAAAQVGEHDGVVNLKLSDGQDLLDLAISNGPCLLYLLCGSWSVWAEGDVVRLVDAEEGALAAGPAAAIVGPTAKPTGQSPTGQSPSGQSPSGQSNGEVQP